MSNILASLIAKTPEIQDRISRTIRQQYDMLVGELGTSMKNVANSGYYSVWTETVRPVCDLIYADPDKRHTPDSKKDYLINEDALARRSAKLAEAVVLAWFDKINEKLGELDNATCTDVGNCTFNINGERNGHKIQIQQDIILNVSSKGRLFNQFPARIYVDGKFTSAAKYTKLFV